MAVKIAAAMGAEVTTISRSDAKAQDAKDLGASTHIATKDEGALRAAKGSFDLIINTVSADLDMKDYVRLLRPGRARQRRAAPGDLVVAPGSLIVGNKAIAGSNIGGIPDTQEMLDFCAEHGIAATVEHVDATDTTAVDAA
ncbi:zinc-binding dehydrogenase, partial [Janibacter melonis]|uniref:zinc-binding dehydrogenase n=1 Tax=Janibacter melonis TaxID=262209 RepID=UPI0027DA0FC4